MQSPIAEFVPTSHPKICQPPIIKTPRQSGTFNCPISYSPASIIEIEVKPAPLTTGLYSLSKGETKFASFVQRKRLNLPECSILALTLVE
jgi:hypothetical protein